MLNKINGWLEHLSSENLPKIKKNHAKSILRCLEYCMSHKSIPDTLKNFAIQLHCQLKETDCEKWVSEEISSIRHVFEESKRYLCSTIQTNSHPICRQSARKILRLYDRVDYLLVTDLEMTCLEGNNRHFTMETIEIGCAVLSTKTAKIVDTFQSFVKPIINPNLSEFCTKLTNIKQSDVDSAKTFPIASKQFEAFIRKYPNSAFIQWGTGDERQLKQDAKHHGIKTPISGIEIINLKDIFKGLGFTNKGFGLKKALNIVNETQAEAHRALIDAVNTSKLIPHMLHKAKAYFQANNEMIYLNRDTLNSHGSLLSYILRHKTQKNVTISSEGWVDVHQLLEGLRKPRKNQITYNKLIEIVNFDKDGRFELNEDNTKIRCKYGHTNTLVDIKYSEFDEALDTAIYHGTSKDKLDEILKCGFLSACDRQYIHLTTDIKKAIRSGTRFGQPAILKLRAKKAQKENHKVFRATDKVVLMKGEVPIDLFDLEDI